MERERRASRTLNCPMLCTTCNVNKRNQFIVGRRSELSQKTNGIVSLYKEVPLGSKKQELTKRE
ncbi:hypothetical protein L9F63_001232, partial [Diploptera punctata]